MPRSNGACSASWTASAGPTTRTTMTSRAAARRAARPGTTARGYQATRRRLAHQERTLAAQRKRLHGQLAHEIVAVGDTIISAQISYRAWQKQFGRSVGLRAPGMFLAMLRRTVASTGGTLVEVPTQSTKLSQ